MRENKPLLPDTVASTYMMLLRRIGRKAPAQLINDVLMDHVVSEYIRRCGYPLNVAEQVAADYRTSGEYTGDMALLRNVNNWYYGGRQVYIFDDDFAELLSRQNKDDLKISAETLKQLPCDSFYIQRKYNTSVGFFFDFSENSIAITEFFTNREPDTYFLRYTTDMFNQMAVAFVGNSRSDDVTGEVTARITEIMQYVVYLSAINAEITPVTKRQVTPRTKNNIRPGDLTRSCVANVGYRIGAAMRRQSTSTTYRRNSDAHGAPKSPHLRRAHFHRFATKDGYVTKWVHAVFVNGDKEQNLPTVHKIDKK